MHICLWMYVLCTVFILFFMLWSDLWSFSVMEPLHNDMATKKAGPSIMRPNTSLASSASSTPPSPNSDLSKPKLPLPTTPTTPSSPSTAFARFSPPPSSRSSSLSTPPASPLRQPIRSLSNVGRSQLNAATKNNLIDSTPAAAAVRPSQPQPIPEPGETSTFLAVFAHC